MSFIDTPFRRVGSVFLLIFLFSAAGRIFAQGPVDAPEFQPVAGAFYTKTAIQVTCATSGATIHYTLNGDEPAVTDPTVVSGGTVLVGRAVTLKARARVDTTWSTVASGTYVVTGQVVAGGTHALALHFEGDKTWAWGGNASGQLGDGTTTDRSAVVRVQANATPADLTGVLALAAGGSHTLALKDDHTVLAWGENGSGQLGDTTTTDRLYPVAVSGLSSIVDLAAGSEHSLALDDDGAVWAWGKNTKGQIGIGSTTSPQSAKVQVLTGVSTGLSGIVRVAGGNEHSIALESDGDVWAWGANGSGQLGDGTTTDRLYATATLVSGAKYIAAGKNFSLAVKNDGTVMAWGANSKGQLGHGTTTASEATPVAVYRVNVGMETGDQALTGVLMVAAGDTHALALTDDGKVWAWGDNQDGRLGDSTTTDRNKAVHVKTSGGADVDHAVMIACGADFSIILKDDGSILTWGVPALGRLGNGQTTGTYYNPATNVNLPKTAYVAPTLTLSSPSAGSFIAPADFTLQSGVNLSNGTPAGLNFLVNGGSPIAGALTSSTPPNFQFSASWNGVGIGSYSLKARVTDSYGGVTDSVPVAVTVVPPTVSISPTTASVAESSGSPVVLTVSRNPGAPTTLPLNVSYVVTGTADSDDDITELPGTVTIPATQMSATINVTPQMDSRFEASETVIVTLTGAGGQLQHRNRGLDGDDHGYFAAAE